MQGNSNLANDVAVYAYYLLLVGVVLQLVVFLKTHTKTQRALSVTSGFYWTS